MIFTTCVSFNRTPTSSSSSVSHTVVVAPSCFGCSHVLFKTTAMSGVALMLVLLLLLMTSSCTWVHSDALADGSWLALLYSATNGLEWTSGCTTGWNIANPGSVCSRPGWYGVRCNASNSKGVVTSVDLNNCNLQGSLPEIQPLLSGQTNTALKYCKLLYLDYNILTGTVPSSFSSLSSLQSLYLSSNILIGTLPSTFSDLSSLRDLYLDYNSLTGTLPGSFGSLSSLQHFSVSSNSFTGTLPASFGSLSSLQYLDLSSNRLTGTIPTSFGNLASLQHMYLSSNSLTGSLPSTFSSLSSLQGLHLNSNSLSGTIPFSYGGMTSLRLMWLHVNILGGSLPSSFGNLSSLQQFSVFSNGLVGTLHSSYDKLSSLQTLSAYSNSLTGTLPPSFGSLSSLQYLDLSSNRLTGTIPTSFGNLASLQYLYLSSNSLLGSMPASFSSLSSLLRLVLSSNSLTGTLPASYCNMSSLWVLYLSSNSLIGTLPSSWYILRSASYDASNNYLTGDIPSSWLWSNATIRGAYFTGNCLNVSNMSAVTATSRFVAGTPRSDTSVCAAVAAAQGQIPRMSTRSASTNAEWSQSAFHSRIFSTSLTQMMQATGSSALTRRLTDALLFFSSSSADSQTFHAAVVQDSGTRTVSETAVHAVMMQPRKTTPFSIATQSLAILASTVSASSAGFMLQRSALVLRLLACQLSLDAPPDVMTSPTQMTIGSGALRYQRGTVIGNMCVLVGAAAACLLLCCALTWLCRGISDDARGNGDRLRRVAASLRLPGWLVIVWSLLLQPLVAAIVCLLLVQPAAATDLAIGLGGVSVVVLVLTLEVRLLLFRFRAVRRRRINDVGVAYCSDCFGSSILEADDGCEWRDSDDGSDHHPLVKHYGVIFEMYRPGVRRCFHIVDSLFAIVAAVLQGAVLVATSSCSSELLAALCAVQVMYFVMIVAWRPQTKTFEWIKMVVLSGLGAVSAVLAVIPTCADGLCGSIAVEVAQVQVYLAFADLCGIVIMALWSGRLKRFIASVLQLSPERAPCAPVMAEAELPSSVMAASEAVGTAPIPSQKQQQQQNQHDLMVHLEVTRVWAPDRLVRLALLIEQICWQSDPRVMQNHL